MAAFAYRLRAAPRPTSVDDYRRRARRRVPRMAWAYLDRGAESETTLAANRRAFARWALRQSVLTGVESVRTGVEVGGVPLALPILLAPTGLSGLAHASGEPALARAAERAGTRAVVSTAASYSIEEVAAATGQDHFFQLYPGPAGTDLTERFIDRARQAGYAGLMVTVDTPAIGNREAERRAGMGATPALTPAAVLDAALRPAWTYRYLREGRVVARNFVEAAGARAGVEAVKQHAKVVRPDMVWDDLARMRERWDGAFMVKGILDPDDAEKAAAIGADGIVVSNHGGRQLDGAPATLDTLPAIAARAGDRLTILLDGGVRRGADVVKALCLGADAVMIGRPALYGLAAEGQTGVEGVLAILRDELETTMVLMGVGSITELDPHHLIPADAALTASDGEAGASDG
ncbi:MAG TPA: alpha-hydroxy acid oxidase [Solirubrobacterales bacterium]|jgi:L-lactate dehydrogenase (cytochrome)/(S)-mandelate dehydrogenase